jgi:hypothetical protein
VITPIISNIVGGTLSLGSTSNATVVLGAINPTGIEPLVWVEATTNAENEADIQAECTPADSTSAPNFYYAPCQDLNNVDQYLLFQEARTVNYRFQVRNSGNLALTNPVYSFRVDGTIFNPGGTCGNNGSSIPNSWLGVAAAPAVCTFSRPTTVPSGTTGIVNQTVTVTVSAQASGLPTGQTHGNATVQVVPRPKFVVNVRANRYRLGGTGDGVAGAPAYANGNLTLNNSTDINVDQDLRTPTGWLFLTVANQGGQADNFALTLTQNGSPIDVTLFCTVPTSLDPVGGANDSFGCLLPAAALAQATHTFALSATADNSTTVSGQQNVQIAVTPGCTGNNRPVPNLVDVLSPTPDGNRNTVADAQALWGPVVSGFNGLLTTSPPIVPVSNEVISQNLNAYSCANLNSGITVTAP